jgi:hypothetical protein
VQLQRVYFPVDERGATQRELAPPLWSIDVRASQAVTRHAELAVGIDNLLNTRDDFMVVLPFTFYASLRGRY